MLESISITGFKSVRKKTDLVIAPLTVFTGANSSGKSTVLQTLLLQAQTLQSTVHSASVVLNGHIERLGKFSDIASMGKNQPITLGFSLVPDPEEDLMEDSGMLRQSLLHHPWNPFFRVRGLKSVRCQYSFSGDSEGDETSRTWDLEPIVSKAALSATAVTGTRRPRRTSVTVTRSSRKLRQKADDLHLDAANLDRYSGYLQYDVVNSGASGEGMVRLWYVRELGVPTKSKPQGAQLYHFVPDSEVTVVDEVGEFADSFVGFLESWKSDQYSRGFFSHYIGQYESDPQAPSAFGKPFLSLVLSAIDRVSGEAKATKRDVSVLADAHSMLTAETRATISGLFAKLEKLSPAVRVMFWDALSSPKDALREALVNHRAPHMIVVPLQMDPACDLASLYVRRFFAERLKYVGPLRDQPRAVYPLSGYLMSERDVGFRGENAAAVLHNFWNSRVSNVSPESLASNPDEIKTIQEPLGQAVQKWLSFLSVAESVRTEDQGTEGHGVYATPFKGAGEHDLAHVGVGISQVLPIVVESLVSDRGSLLLFEQPELHLHPKVQSRLADFFFALTALGKQCIVETHSEYLINRLRYLRACATGDTFEKALRIYFAEIGPEGSSFHEVHMDKYGAIDDWPDGFFDEGERLASDIARAGLAKSRSTRAHESD